MSKKNPLSKRDKIAKRIEPELETDAFGADEQKRIVDMVLDDANADMKVMEGWIEDRRLDLLHYDCAPPSILENLTKDDWMSDRNLGLCPAVVDIYHATFKATSWNPSTIFFKATEKNDIDNKENLERFAKWMIGEHECNCSPEVDDYIHNKLTQAFSIFHIYWKVWYEWVDRRIPKKDGGYTIKTEKMRFEKGVMENISTVEDILIPRYGKHLQDLPHMIHVIHNYGHELLDFGDRNIMMNVTEKWVTEAKTACLHARQAKLDKEKAKQLKLADISDEDLRSFPVDIHVWYGIYKKGRKTEKYRFMVDLATQTFLAGKPLRKITRSGKYPFVGGTFIKKPGFIVGKSLVRLIAPIVNAFNNVFNQKADFQYMTNCPFGFFKPDEHFKKQEFQIKPMVLFPTEDPNEINIPNIQRSMAWAESDIKILFEMLERLTGAASYFLTTQTKQGTLGRDVIVERKGETKFGLWVGRLQEELCEGIGMLVNLYQDNAPPKLGERVLGEDGKQLIRNLSVESLRGNYGAYMTPDVTAGSKAYEREVQLWGFANLQQSPWFDPRVNAKGSWNLTADAIKKVMGVTPERYLPPEPKSETGTSREVKDEWARFMQGEKFSPPEGATPQVMEHMVGHMKQKEEQYQDLDEEYRFNFDQHLFETQLNFRKFLAGVQQERMANSLAMNMVQNREAGIGTEQRREPVSPGAGGILGEE